jgi:hypothetical protein
MEDFDAFLNDLMTAGDVAAIQKSSAPKPAPVAAPVVAAPANPTAGVARAPAAGQAAMGGTVQRMGNLTIRTGMVFDVCPKCRSADVTTNRARAFSVCEHCGYAIDPTNAKSRQQLSGAEGSVVDRMREHVATNLSALQQTDTYAQELYKAATANNVKGIRDALDHGVDVNVADDSRRTALHFAAARNATTAIKFLVESGANVNVRNEKGDTPLHLLVQMQSQVMCLWLIQNGADITLRNNSGFSPMSLALGWLQKEMDEQYRKYLNDHNLPDTRSQPAQAPAAAAAAAAKTAAASAAASAAPQPVATAAIDPKAREVLKVYLKNDAYKSVAVMGTTTARDVNYTMCEKLSCPHMFRHMQLYERVKNGDKYFEKPVDDGAAVLEVKSHWPLILGPSGNETHLHCRFIVGLKRGCPIEIQTSWRQIQSS